MKQYIQWAIAVCVFTLSLSGMAAPEFINYQGRLTDLNGAPMVNETNNAADGQIDLAFRLYDAATGGNIMWSQVQPDVAVYNGLFSVLLNNLNETIFPATNQITRWLEVEVRAGAITNILQPRKEIVSVAYAIRAGSADMVDGKHAGELGGGITNEVDPTVTNWVKDGVSWVELKSQGMPIDFSDDIDNVGITNWAQLKAYGMPAGFTDDVDNIGITNWVELITNGMPAGFADGIDDVGITNEVDPQVDDALTFNSVPRWDGAQLLTGSIYNDPAGKVGIGTTNPASSLDVNGNANISGSLSVAGILSTETNIIQVMGTNIITNWPHTSVVGNLNADMVDGKHASELGGITNEADPTVVNWVKDGESWTEMKGQGMPADFADDVDNVGITVETDPTVTNWVKDGVSWVELKSQGMPIDFSDDIDNVGITNWAQLKAYGMPAGFADDVDNAGIIVEDDPQVGVIANNYVPRWDGAQLLTGSIYNDPAGKVGIGTTMPVTILDVRGNSSVVGPQLSIQDTVSYNASPMARIDFAGQYNAGGDRAGFAAIKGGKENTVNGNSAGYLGLWTYRNGDPDVTERVRIDSSGSVGIGTASPGEKLDIVGKIRSSSGFVYNAGDGTQWWLTGTANGPAVMLQQHGGLSGSTYRRGSLGWMDNAGGKFEVLTWDGGSVGIGTPSPAYKLDVNGDAMIRNVLYLNYSDNRIEAIRGDYHPYLALTVADGYTVLKPGPTGFRVTNWENAGPPNWYGNNLILNNDGELYLPYGLLHEGSDSRLKQNQEPLDYGLAEVLELKPKRYIRTGSVTELKTEKQEKEDESEIGLIAQEVYEVIPEAVALPDEVRKTWCLSYSSLVPVLVKAIQEQQKQIEELKDKITRLERKNTK